MIGIIRTVMTGVACLMIMGCTANEAAAQERPYKLDKAYEVLSESGDEEQALKLLDEQLDDTPDNAECWMLRCRIHRNQDEYGKALSDVNNAIRVNRPKKSGLYTSTLYWWKADMYEGLGDKEQTVVWLKKALDQARKDNRKNIQNISFDYGQALYSLKRYAESDAVYRQMLREDESDQAAMVGLARNMIAREDYSSAVAILDDAERFGSDYSSVYKFRCRAYDKMGETDKAIDDAVSYYELDEDAEPLGVATILVGHRSYAVAKVKEKMNRSESPSYWRVLLIGLYEKLGEYGNAIAEYDAVEKEHGANEYLHYARANAYDEVGMVDKALADIDKALAMSNDYSNNCTKGVILRHAGRYAEAIRSFDAAIEIEPSNAYAYYARGWCYELMGEADKALKDYDEGIDVDKGYPYIFLQRGSLLKTLGRTEQARADFETVLATDTLATSGSGRQYALLHLGRAEEAEQWMQKIIEENPHDAGEYYDYACLLCRMGRYDEALKKLETAFELGYRSFEHIRHDDDMDGLRDMDEFKALMARYEEAHKKGLESVSGEQADSREEKLVEVPISRRSGGTFNVDCEVNGLPLSMIFDTGASDVTISKVEADFMLKNNYLSKDDVKGKQYYQIANGDVSEGTVIMLREVKIGDAVIHDVKASVVKNQKAPLLLGESVLKRFGTYTVDNINSKLIIKH